MNGDDFLNFILSNDPNGPSATQFTNDGMGSGAPSNAGVPYWDDTGLPADIIATLPPARRNTEASMYPLSSLVEAGVSPSITATLLPQRGDAGATQPSTPAFPPPFHLSPEQEAGIRRAAQEQAAVSAGTDAAVSAAAVETGLEALAVPKLIKTLVRAGTGVHDLLDIWQRVRDAPDQAVYKSMNDTLNQAYGSPNMPGFRSRFPFP